ncbi:MAG: spore germination protein [Eubacteriales bacterium]
MNENNITSNLTQTMTYLDSHLSIQCNFDCIARIIRIGGRKGCYYFIDGFCKDEVTEKLLERFQSIEEEQMPNSAELFAEEYVPYIEVTLEKKYEEITKNLLSGVLVLLIDGYEQGILIDARTYPARGIEEPEKDKALRGSKDGFVETIVMNTALIRRRIRSPYLRMEMVSIGTSSKTDVVICYMNDRVNHEFLEEVRTKMKHIQVDALSMNQESLAECLYQGSWINPLPKFKYTQRPDTAASEVLEGKLIILVDNSPSVMITPTTLFDLTQEVDDFYFPPITGTYLRLSRFMIGVMTYLITPTFLLLVNHPQFIPPWLSFILVEEVTNVPILIQFLLLELAIDGLRLASVNTPSMLSTPLSIMAALILGEFSVNSGWFHSEVMLYMAFVALGSYTQPSFELGYAIKFYRILALVFTQLFGIGGYVVSIAILCYSFVTNGTLSNGNYLYPLIPFHGKILFKSLFRAKIKFNKQENDNQMK